MNLDACRNVEKQSSASVSLLQRGQGEERYVCRELDLAMTAVLERLIK